MTVPQQVQRSPAPADEAAPTRFSVLDQILDAASTRAGVTALLPKGSRYDEITAAVRLAARDDPKILQCTAASIRQAVTRAVQMGLEIGVTVHLVPFKVNVAPKGTPKRYELRLTAIADYKGLIELMHASGRVRAIEVPRVVYQGERFEERLGSERYLIHEPDYGKRGGPIVGAYVFFRLFGGQRDWLFLPLAAIEERRKKSQMWSEGKCPPWYAQKSVIRELAKYMPHNHKMRQLTLALREEDEAEAGGGIVDAIVAEHAGDAPPATSSLPRRPGALPAAEDPYAPEAAGEPFDPETGEVLENAGAEPQYQDDRDLDDREPRLFDGPPPARRRDAVREGR